MDYLQKVGLILGIVVGIAGLLIVLLQVARPLMPWHALIPATVIAVLLTIQLLVPWRYRTWKGDGLARLGDVYGKVNIALSVALLLVLSSVLLAAYLAQRAPDWIEQRIQRTVATKQMKAVTVEGRAAQNVALPPLAVATILGEPGSRRNGSAASWALSLYPARTALAEAIGTSKRLSEYAYFGVAIQVIFLLFLVLTQPLLETLEYIKKKEAAS